MQILCVCFTHSNNNENSLRRLIRYLYCSAGRTLETVGQKVSATLEMIWGKVSKILDAIEQGVQNFGYFLKQSFNNFGIIATDKVSSASWKQRIVNNCAKMVQKSRLSNQFLLFAKLHQQLLSMKKLTFWK